MENNIVKHSKVLDKIKELIDSAGIDYDLIEHAPVFTSEDAAKIRDTSLSMGAKALIFYGDKKPLLIVLPGDKKVNFRKFKLETGIKDLRMASKEEVYNLTGITIGAIPPVGKAMGLKSYFDKSLKHKNKVSFNAGAHTVSIMMHAHDLIKLEDPILIDLI